MVRYIIKEFKTQDAYKAFIEYVVQNSSHFSLVYMRYSKNDRMKHTVRYMHDKLAPFKVKSM